MSDEQYLREYLLGSLPPNDDAQIEKRRSADPEFDETLSAVEEELIDDYVRGDLTSEEHRQFEKQYLGSSEGRQKIEFAAAFLKSVREGRAPTRPGISPDSPSAHAPLSRMAWLPAAALLLLIGAVMWWHNSHREIAAPSPSPQGAFAPGSPMKGPLSEAPQPTQKKPDLPTEPDQVARAPQIVSVVLRPGLLRDSGAVPRILISRGTSFVDMSLETTTEALYRPLQAAIRTPEGQEVWHQELSPRSSPPPGRPLRLRIPATVLKSGDYIVILSHKSPAESPQPVDSYVFRVAIR